MSFRAAERFLANSKSTGANRLVGFVLAHLANERGQCWHGLASLMKKTRLSERQIQTSTRELQQASDINIYLRAGPNGVNVYQVLCFGGPTDLELSQQLPPADKVLPSAPRTICTPLEGTSQNPNEIEQSGAQSAPPQIMRGAQGMSPSAPKWKGMDKNELKESPSMPEVPSEEEVQSEASKYAGSLAIGTAPGIPESWWRRWYAGKLGYRNFAWERWRLVLRLDYERDFRDGRVGGFSKKTPRGGAGPDRDELRHELEQARHYNDEKQIVRLTKILEAME